ncbi:MAG: PD-(D/E)XK nuclease family protein [Methanothrix sp.]|nr:PD-(D/E)XK nuclease family protein [Methanothrix sp.]
MTENSNLLVLHASGLNDIDACRRAWLWSQQYSPMKPVPAFWLGTNVHAGLEAYYRQLSPEVLSLPKAPEAMTPAQIALQEYERFGNEAYEKVRQLSGSLWETFSIEFDEAYSLGHKMLQNYFIFDATDPLPGEVEKVEGQIEIEIIPGVGLSGRIDMVRRDGNRRWIVDHKTSSSGFGNFAPLDIDGQLTAYAYLYYAKTGVLVDGLIYNVLIKSLPNFPEVLKSGGLSKSKSQATVYALYVSALEELFAAPYDAIPGEALVPYVEILNHLQQKGWSSFFQRASSTRNWHELESFQNHLVEKAKTALSIIEDPERLAYPSPSTYTCGWCPFLSVCKAKEDGGDYQAILDSRFLKGQVW